MTKVTPVDEEYIFEDGLIVSSTDLKGIVTYANRKFCEMSGYKKEELIGANHNIIRHPDMPRVAFDNLWSKIRNGQEWEGVVKNLRQDGKYYWVHTFITPIRENGRIMGYSAARRPANQKEIESAQSLYNNLSQQEEKKIY
ncbi:Signal transduction sensor histidine kinase [Sulfurovum sp. enrichment culture clone C5]|uniref:Signal transduction sensor histidine kinase n=1 Tax=Sulfurovum sp. enrichment culture clone C5 TaxID=497650 RepID=A0A0S4XQF1_9BACT|nr:Signal transduction sensor histidine kinase [Sulfurovum sp. enrichment culture clone C5]